MLFHLDLPWHGPGWGLYELSHHRQSETDNSDANKEHLANPTCKPVKPREPPPTSVAIDPNQAR